MELSHFLEELLNACLPITSVGIATLLLMKKLPLPHTLSRTATCRAPYLWLASLPSVLVSFLPPPGMLKVRSALSTAATEKAVYNN